MKMKHIIILQNKIDLIQESVAINQHESIQKFIQVQELDSCFLTGLLLEMSLCFVMCNDLFGLCGDEDKDADIVSHMNIVALSTVVVAGNDCRWSSCSANFRTAQVQC
jgi:hypothetical protein